MVAWETHLSTRLYVQCSLRIVVFLPKRKAMATSFSGWQESSVENKKTK